MILFFLWKWWSIFIFNGWCSDRLRKITLDTSISLSVIFVSIIHHKFTSSLCICFSYFRVISNVTFIMKMPLRLSCWGIGVCIIWTFNHSCPIFFSKLIHMQGRNIISNLRKLSNRIIFKLSMTWVHLKVKK